MRYVIGMDGGGTATVVDVYSPLDGKEARITGGAINPNGGSREQIATNISELLEKVKADFGPLSQCAGLCMGAAGVSNVESRCFLEQCLRESGYTGPFSVVADSETALYGAFEGKPGAILIAGTGSICYGMSAEGHFRRTGGLGYLLDDGGSGYRIGQEILSAVVRAWDGRAPACIFSQFLIKEGIADAETLSSNIYNSDAVKGKIAGYAKYLPAAYAQNDPTAIEIAKRMIEQLIDLAVPVVGDLGLHQDRLALCGGVFQHHPYIKEGFVYRMKTLFPEMTYMPPMHDAAYGARLIALNFL